MRKPTVEELKMLLDLHSRTTAGTWESFVEGRDHMGGSSFIRTAGDDIEMSGLSDFNQDFLARAHNLVPLLIAEIERLRNQRVSLITDSINHSLQVMGNSGYVDSDRLSADYKEGSQLYSEITSLIEETIERFDDDAP